MRRMDHALNGARPGPRLAPRTGAVLAILLLVPVPGLGTALAMSDDPGTFGRAAFLASKVWILALPVLWYLLIDRGRLGWPRPSKQGIRLGAALGLLIAAVIGIVYLALGSALIDPATVKEKATDTGIAQREVYLGVAAYMCLINAALEEYVWRWFIFRKCEVLVPAAGGWIAVALSAVFFTIHHVIALRAQFDWPVVVLGSLGVLIGGMVWSWCFLRYRTIWPGYVSHVIVDIAIFAIGWHLIFG